MISPLQAHNNTQVLNLIVLLLLMLLAAGCGFHLRGTQQSLNTFQGPLVLVYQAQDAELLRLERHLAQRGVRIDDRASTQLHILGYDHSKRPASFADGVTVTSFLLRSQLRYAIHHPEQPNPIERSVYSQRAFRFDENNIAGKAQEEALIKDEMTQDLVQQLLLQLSRRPRTDTAP